MYNLWKKNSEEMAKSLKGKAKNQHWMAGTFDLSRGAALKTNMILYKTLLHGIQKALICISKFKVRLQLFKRLWDALLLSQLISHVGSAREKQQFKAVISYRIHSLPSVFPPLRSLLCVNEFCVCVCLHRFMSTCLSSAKFCHVPPS